MADFKLSRVRFNWKGAWFVEAQIIIDDMIEYNGYTYVALRTHTQQTFTTIWQVLIKHRSTKNGKNNPEGVSWKKDWTVSTNYSVGNIVKYGASVYECTEAHTSIVTLGSWHRRTCC